MIRRKVFLAGPLFNPSEREHSERVRDVLMPFFDVYLPHADGGLLPDLLGSGMSARNASSLIFSNDIAALRQCDILLAILNGRTVDEGTAFELGVAWCLGKPCWGFKDDFRQMTASGDNPMIEGALRETLTSLDALKMWAAAYDLDKKSSSA